MRKSGPSHRRTCRAEPNGLHDLYDQVESLACESERDRGSDAVERSEDGIVNADCADVGGLQRCVHSLDDLGDPCPANDLAAALSKSPKTIIDWCQERTYTRIPCFKIGNRWYHRLPEVKRWLKGIQSGQVEFRRKPRSKKGR